MVLSDKKKFSRVPDDDDGLCIGSMSVLVDARTRKPVSFCRAVPPEPEPQRDLSPKKATPPSE